jgi:hypothetical protein
MRGTRCAAVVAVLLLAGCGGQSSPKAAPTSPASTSTPTPSPKPVATPLLDSIAVLGHSGATGTKSDPNDPNRDARENSWATGDNPQVQSIYLRLLQNHPALKGHNYNQAIDGSRVDDLGPEFSTLLTDANPLPDVILIQTIDNDIRCDGTDAANYGPFGRTLDHMLTRTARAIPGVQFFLVSQWATVRNWAAWAAHHESQVLVNSGTGPCDVFDEKGALRPKGIRSLQAIVDSYWAQLERVCSKHPGCFTDHGAEERFVPTDKDLGPDLNHLSIAGHKKYAELAWRALPEQIKKRP